MSTVPLLCATINGDTLELSPSGSWTAAYATVLESLVDVALPTVKQTRSPKIDMTDVHELDTLGAWLLEKMSRGTLEPDHPATVVGVANRYEGLIEDLRRVNRRKSASRSVQNPVLARLEAIGRSHSAPWRKYPFFYRC